LSASASAAFATSYFGGHLEAVEISPAGGAWVDVTGMVATAQGFPSTVQKFIFEYPLVPAGVPGATLALGATGSYDTNADQFVSAIVAAGLAAKSIVVIAAEFNWSGVNAPASGNPSGFLTYWNRVAAKMKAAGIQTCWSVSLGQTDIDPSTVYPTAANVDYIGAVLYDYKYADSTVTAAQRWSNFLTETYGLNWLEALGRSKNRPLIFTRWGLDLSSDTLTGPGGGGDDDTLFVQNTHDWIASKYVAAFCPYQVDFAG
jgi:hypothetical protein